MTADRITARGKLVLPTVETCRYRRAIEASGAAQCDLLQTITGLTDEGLCLVSQDVCSACCESFPPTVSTWNSVIASLVYELADRVLMEGGVVALRPSTAQQLRAAAAGILAVAPSPTSHVIPLRSQQPCCYLGARLDTNENAGGSDPVAAFQCNLPDHGTTNPDHCRRCRDWSAQKTISRRMGLHELVPPADAPSSFPVRRWSLGVVTAPRREATLEWCLDSLVRAGWTDPHLFVDGRVQIPAKYEHLPLTWRELPVGAWPNYFLSLAELVQRDPEADAYLLLQDDAILFDGADLKQYLEATLWPGRRPGLVSLYCPQPYTVLKPGWRELPQPWIWGALAFVFPGALAREFISNRGVVAHRWNGPHEGRVQVDVLIGEWAAAQGHAVHYPSPSLVQHVGNTSSIWPSADSRGFRRADWFAGDVESPFAVGECWSEFPEGLFPSREPHRPEYERRVSLGRQRMAERRVVVCGLCRSVRHFLPQFAARAERLGSMFRDYRVVLYENDSVDATVEFLHDWQQTSHRVQVLTERLGAVHYPSIRSAERVTRLAEHRNRYRTYTIENFGDFDDVVVIDTDIAGGWSNDGIANTFGHDEWDFVGSWGLIRIHSEQDFQWRQYDVWTFRAVGHPHAHSPAELNAMVCERGDPMIPVWSCFGGLGVYRMAAFKCAEYGGPDCEHVIQHERMRKRGMGRLFLNPSQIVLYSPAP